ncbi:hypothetical protein MYCTH_2299343 [Thermothelomyces thermophilus ATCC 42464]|uniref:Nuclear rim protein 1 n=1 Tax=Thermothelomyces thermophilus (strain ATCC 42464 / BCRC 31852 / DSM 1799) TaxID=573729 RepID=G2Q5P1_THET4|nr:uncharacterized protein MYCTH_2299343 [Thermothelomyces thermophilus ATCC 42464]AEO55477.1 hypothetical protein MYCTH_2299343 [Thermothelomyces thermophilus ATCC 42464]
MPPRPQRLVRRQPLGQRLRAMLNPMDFYLWLSEEIQTFDWDSKAFGTRFGLAANFVFLIARANAGKTRDAVDDVFGDAPANGWFTLLANFLQWTLISISVLNAFYAMTRSRHYRLFEVNVEAAGPGTPSAQRVRVDSPPASSTPLRLIQEVLRPETAEQRAHPDRTRDVWEMKVWDPYPATLRMFCLFSPGHILIHMLFLPLPNLDPRPSVTVFKCFLLQVILSAQLLLLHSRFSQQSKDTAIIHKEVMHEYDVKYVHPRLQPVVREVSTQVSISDGKVDQEEITVGTPTTVIRRSFQTHPNPSYARYVNSDAGQSTPTRTTMSPQLRPATPSNPFTPAAKPRTSVLPSFAAQVQQQRQSSLRNSLPSVASTTDASDPPPAPFSAAKPSASAGTSTGVNFNVAANSGYGGSMGVFTHMNSPLKKATSLGDMNGGYPSPRNNREMAALEQRDLAERMVRQSSPSKEHRRPTGTGTGAAQLEQGQGQGQAQGQGQSQGQSLSASSFMHSPEKLARARANRWTQERFPTRYV